MLTGILALIGVLNLINTLVTSVISRRLELAMLEAVGMTKGIQIRSICFEGLICGVLAVIAGLLLSGAFSVFFVRILGLEMWFFAWKFTLLPVLVLSPVMALMTVMIPVMIYKLTIKQSVVERLRMAEA